MKPYISVCAFTIYNTNLRTQLCLETDVPTQHRSFKPNLRTMGPNRSPFKSLGKSVMIKHVKKDRLRDITTFTLF